MIRLKVDDRLIIKPRQPYNAVFVSEEAYASLVNAQDILDPQGIKLILTRGYENQGYFLRHLHAFARVVGAFLFLCLYPDRNNERGEIFSPNGHDIGGVLCRYYPNV